MANLYLDEDVPRRVADLLRDAGHVVATTHELGLSAAPDHLQLLTAFRRQSITVTRNRQDFVELHGAWLAWSREWGAAVQHGGIVVVPQQEGGVNWTPEVVVARLEMLLAEGLPRANQLHRWRNGGWVRQG